MFVYEVYLIEKVNSVGKIDFIKSIHVRCYACVLLFLRKKTEYLHKMILIVFHPQCSYDLLHFSRILVSTFL